MSLFKKMKPVERPGPIRHRLSKREKAERILEIIKNPQDYQKQVRILLEIQRKGWFGRPKFEVYEATITGYTQVDTMHHCHARFLCAPLTTKKEGILRGVTVIVGDWHSHHYPMDQKMQIGDVFVADGKFQI